jgi:hypothetical protein
MNYREVLQLAADYDAKLLCTDPRFGMSVKVIHREGSSFFWNHAFLMSSELDTDPRWLFVFTEHHKFRVFDKSDLLWFAQYSRVCEIETI